MKRLTKVRSAEVSYEEPTEGAAVRERPPGGLYHLRDLPRHPHGLREPVGPCRASPICVEVRRLCAREREIKCVCGAASGYLVLGLFQGRQVSEFELWSDNELLLDLCISL